MNHRNLFIAIALAVFGFESIAQEEKWAWEKIGNEISKMLPTGEEFIRLDFDWKVCNSAEKTNRMIAGSSHISTFSPTYVAATIIEAALIPVGWSYGEIKGSSEGTANVSAESSKKNFEEDNRELRKELEESKKREQELRSRLNDQAEKFIESYDTDTKIGYLEPEFKKYLDETRNRILTAYFEISKMSGASPVVAKTASQNLSKRIYDIDLAVQFLARSGGSI